MSGMLPYDSDDNKETARQTIYDPVPFGNKVWQFVTEEAKDLITSKSNSIIFFRAPGERQIQAHKSRRCISTSLDMQKKQRNS